MRVLALGEVVTAQHVRLGLGKADAVTLVGAAGKPLLFGPHQPANIVGFAAMAFVTVKDCGFDGFAFVKEIAFVHASILVGSSALENGNLGLALPTARLWTGGV